MSLLSFLILVIWIFSLFSLMGFGCLHVLFLIVCFSPHSVSIYMFWGSDVKGVQEYARMCVLDGLIFVS
jgi:hypothetical protein